MDDFKQLEPTLPQRQQSAKPQIPKKPIEADSVPSPLENRRPTYSSALKNSRFVNREASNPPLSPKDDAMGFAKVEMPSPAHENASQSNGPKKALPKGLVATRFANLSPPQLAQPSISTVDSSFSAECDDLMNFEFDQTDVSPSARDTSPPDSHPRPPRHSDRKPAYDEDGHAYHNIDELRRTLKSWITRSEIAEEKAERMEKRIKEIKNLQVSALTEPERDMNAHVASLDELKAENSALKEQLRDAQSHIFSLQPYRKELTPEEVGRQYDDLVEGITDWVLKFMSPLLDNHATGLEELMTSASKKPTEAHRLRRSILAHADLTYATRFPETDEDVIIAVIMRFLDDNIFQKILYNSIAPYVNALSFIEMAMQNYVEPKRDIFAIRTWTAEAYNAIVSCQEFRGVREKRMRELTIELARTFKILCRKNKLESFFKGCEENCVKPAMQLYEKMLVSTNHFYLDINPYIIYGEAGEFQTSPDFVDSLPDLDCKNVLQNRKAFSLAKMDPAPSRRELYHRLFNVCTLTPALYMRQIGRKDAVREPQLVRRQQMLVAWGDSEKRDAFVHGGEQTLLAHLCSARSDRERAEAGGWTPFRWGG